jgi:3-hydroxyisobutyrate dehydrogenase-like beta-hydroxyacid dehydrogenase
MEAGYLGLGAMGLPMAHKLIDAGHSLTIYDINEAAIRPLLERQARRGVTPSQRKAHLLAAGRSRRN